MKIARDVLERRASVDVEAQPFMYEVRFNKDLRRCQVKCKVPSLFPSMFDQEGGKLRLDLLH